MKRLFLFLLLLTGCSADPLAGDFVAPKFGKVTVETESFRARISCPVSGNISGISDYGIRFDAPLKQSVSTTFADGILKADVKALEPETDYRCEFFLTNGLETITLSVTFRTEEGPETVEIPDPVFRRYLLGHFDTNDDGVIAVPEAMQIRRIEVCTDSIASLRGIERMERLQELIARGNDKHGKLYNIDLSGNPLLQLCQLDDNQLKEVDLSCLPMLLELGIGGNPLTAIDFSKNPRIVSIGLNDVPLNYLPDMTFLDLESLHFDHVARYIPEDYFNHFPRMTGCNIGFYEGRHIDFSQNLRLDSVWCYNSPNLEELDLTASTCTTFDWIQTGNCPNLQYIYLRKGSTINHLDKGAHTEVVYIE